MKFIKVDNNHKHAPAEGREVGYLWTDNWNDWFKYSTMYYFTYFDRQGEKHDIGQVKIGEFNWAVKQRRPNIPENFQQLSGNFFSLGQDIDYYNALMQINEEEREAIFTALCDVASDDDLYARALQEDVMEVSLMRSTGARKVEIQYRAILNEGAELTPYEFSYTAAKTKRSLTAPIQLDFEVTPGSLPPTNIHVLIGRNGVGKTRLLNGMTSALVDPDTTRTRDGEFEFEDQEYDLLGDASETFANLVSVTFSAFDDFLSIKSVPRKQKAIIGYTNVGLRKRIKREGENIVIIQSPERLSSDFAKSAQTCVKGVRGKRWKRALATLETDPLFGEIEVANLAEIEDEVQFVDAAKRLYKKLSSVSRQSP